MQQTSACPSVRKRFQFKSNSVVIVGNHEGEINVKEFFLQVVMFLKYLIFLAEEND